MADLIEFKILNITRERIYDINGRFSLYDKVIYNQNGKTKFILYPYQRNVSKLEKFDFYEEKIRFNNEFFSEEAYLSRNRKKIAPQSVKRLPQQGFYKTFIKIYIIFRYRGKTPFYYPEKGDISSLLVAKNSSETNMLKSVLDSSYSDFKLWLHQAKTNNNIQIYEGWTYKRFFSTTGKFNGDTIILDWKETKFNGTNRGRTFDRLKEFR